MKITDFTVPELERFRAVCNFTVKERAFFELRADPNEYTLEDIAERMHMSVSSVKVLSRSVKAKIIRVI